MNTTRHWATALLLMLACCAGAPVQAQTAVEEEAATTTISTEGYQERRFDEQRLQEYRNNPDYQYQREKPEPPKRKPKPREHRRISETRAPSYSGPRGDFSGLAAGIFWTIIIGAAIFLLLQLLRVNWSFLLKKKSDKAKVVAEKEIPIEEDVTKMEFEDLVQSAVDAGNYRLAVRLLYLRALRQLSDQQLIIWRKEKTNHEYMRELKDKGLRPAFGDVTLIFEYIWYGEFPVNKNDFNLARASFVQFEQTLRQSHAV